VGRRVLYPPPTMTPPELPYFVVDAFTSRPFSGNPAAVVPLAAWVPDATMQAIAAEMNLSETAFFVPDPSAEGDYGLRWFTPRIEVDLCGHATLATAAVVLRSLEPARDGVRFHTRSGALDVARVGARFTMNFPSRPPAPVPLDDGLAETLRLALGIVPVEVHRARDLIVVVSGEAEVRALRPDLARVAQLDAFALTVTALADDPDTDFVSRFFAPAKGVAEDPVTGSSHCSLAPLWGTRLGKTRLRARQLSERGGDLVCTLRDARVHLEGDAVMTAKGTLLVG
jgi:PhzF family phenazine biosynthesis protein